MAFDDLTENQHRLVVQLVEELATGNYGSQFWAAGTMGKGWFITLQGVGGAENEELTGFEETDLLALEDEGYVRLIPKNASYAGALKQKAYDQYKLLQEPDIEKPIVGCRLRGGKIRGFRTRKMATKFGALGLGFCVRCGTRVLREVWCYDQVGRSCLMSWNFQNEARLFNEAEGFSIGGMNNILICIK